MSLKEAFRTLVASALAAVAFPAAAIALTPAVRDIDITVRLTDDGDAVITERWDVTVTGGTEWYLVRNNLDGITISDLSVSEHGRSFVNEGSWDVDRSIAQKAGRCGILRNGQGCELCWGVGSYGDHVFTVSYRMNGAARAIDDCDIFHVQLVSPGLSSPPLHVRAEISADTAPIDTTNARIWGFGFYGNAAFTPGGSAVFESSVPFGGESSMIVLLRLDRGVIHPTSVRNTTFDKVQKKAFKGSDYKQGGSFLEDLLQALASLLLPILVILIPVKARRRSIANILGVRRKKDVTWSREIPFGGDLASADYVLDRLGERHGGNYVASAMILRMIQRGCLSVGSDEKGRTEISFGDEKSLETFGASERRLWAFMKQASGADQILQYREFGKWSARHTEDINDWLTDLSLQGQKTLAERGYKLQGKFTPDGQAEARKALGLKKFLSDYTLIDERASKEAVIWQDYLVFGAMFGIADKVAAELKDINPRMFEEATMYDYTTMRGVINMSDVLARSITNAKLSYDQKQMPHGSIGGFGGPTSFGGGGGFSGGGFGGGSR